MNDKIFRKRSKTNLDIVVDDPTLKAAVKLRMKERGLRQLDVIKATGIPQSYLSVYINHSYMTRPKGHNRMSQYYLLEVCRFLDIQVGVTITLN